VRIGSIQVWVNQSKVRIGSIQVRINQSKVRIGSIQVRVNQSKVYYLRRLKGSGAKRPQNVIDAHPFNALHGCIFVLEILIITNQKNLIDN
jgi:hypothetical protein